MLILRLRVPKSLQFSLQISRIVDFFEDFSQKVYKTAEMKTFLQTFAVPHPPPPATFSRAASSPRNIFARRVVLMA